MRAGWWETHKPNLYRVDDGHCLGAISLCVPGNEASQPTLGDQEKFMLTLGFTSGNAEGQPWSQHCGHSLLAQTFHAPSGGRFPLRLPLRLPDKHLNLPYPKLRGSNARVTTLYISGCLLEKSKSGQAFCLLCRGHEKAYFK